MIRSGNGISVEMDGVTYRFDPKRVVEDDVCMISHAHTDHLPTSFKVKAAVCTEITRDFVRARRGHEIEALGHPSIELLEAGHIPGSRMFLVKGSERVLYTGDFCTRTKEHTVAAKPRKCDILVMEATYGRPEYVFPDHREMMGSAKDWLESIVQRGGSAVLYAYPLGKAQELSAAFKDLPLVLHPTIAENNRILRRHGYNLSDRDRLDPHAPVVYITSGMGKDRAVVERLISKGAKTAAFSGWALDGAFNYVSNIDEAFPVSDHSGYDELMTFVEKCDPRTVFTTHGFARELASDIRRQLGIDAQPLVARQSTIDHFC